MSEPFHKKIGLDYRFHFLDVFLSKVEQEQYLANTNLQTVPSILMFKLREYYSFEGACVFLIKNGYDIVEYMLHKPSNMV